MIRTSNIMDVSKLTFFLEEIHDVTKKTRLSICNSCDDTSRLLSNWYLPKEERDDVAECTCTLIVDINNSNVDKINRGIGDVVENAQKLRTKLMSDKSDPAYLQKSSTNSRPQTILSRKATTSRTPTTQVSCPLLSISGYKTENPSKSTNPLFKGSVRRNIQTTTSLSASISLKTKKPSMQSIYQQSFVEPLPSSRKRNASIHVTYPKDFANKPKDIRPNKSITISNNPTEPISMVELDKLLNRVVIDATLYSKLESNQVTTIPEKQMLNDKCLIHGKNIHLKNMGHPFENQVGLKEAIDVLGVPSDLVKVLQTYHRYINKFKIAEEEPRTKSANKFLDQLTKMNVVNWGEAMEEPSTCLFADYMLSFQELTDISTKKIRSSHELQATNENFEELEKMYRKCANHDNTSCLPKMKSLNSKPPLDDLIPTNLAINGIWNKKSIHNFHEIENSFSTRYTNIQQLQDFSDKIQQFQRLHFQLSLTELLISDILPQLQKMSTNDPDFFMLLKICIVLNDINNLRLPVIIQKSQ